MSETDSPLADALRLPNYERLVNQNASMKECIRDAMERIDEGNGHEVRHLLVLELERTEDA